MRIDLRLQHPDFQTAFFLFILQTLVHQLFDLAAHGIYGLSDESDLVLAFQRFLLTEIPLRNSAHMIYQPVNRFSDRIGKQKRHGNSKEHTGDKDQANRLHEHQAVIFQICHVHDFDHQGTALGFLVIRYQMRFPIYLISPGSTFFLSPQNRINQMVAFLFLVLRLPQCSDPLSAVCSHKHCITVIVFLQAVEIETGRQEKRRTVIVFIPGIFTDNGDRHPHFLIEWRSHQIQPVVVHILLQFPVKPGRILDSSPVINTA